MVVGQVGVVAVVGVVIVAVMVAGVTNRGVICIVSVSRFTVCAPSYPSTASINLSISDIFMHTSKQG